MNDATDDGGTRKASTVETAPAGADGDAGAAGGARPRGRPGRKPRGSVPAIVADVPD